MKIEVNDIVERLRGDVRQLTKMAEAAKFAGAETGVRVRDPSLLVTDLTDAANEINLLHDRMADVEAEAMKSIRGWLTRVEKAEAELAHMRQGREEAEASLGAYQAERNEYGNLAENAEYISVLNSHIDMLKDELARALITGTEGEQK